MATTKPELGPAFSRVLLSLLLVGLALPAQAAQLNLSNPNDAVKARQKMICSLEEGKTIVYWWKGGAFSRVPGEKDRHLFNVEGMNIRHCKNFQDDERGHGFRSVSREVLFYLDPASNEMLRNWTNPWTGEEVEVMHVANDPVNMRAPLYAYSAEGKPATFDAMFVNGRVITSGEAPLFYKNPLAGDYQAYVGNMYHARVATNFYAYEEERVGLEAARLGLALIEDLLPEELCPEPRHKDSDFDFQEQKEELIGLAQRRQFGPSTASLVKAAEARDIPWIRLNDYSLVQFGHGRYQKRIQATITSETRHIAVDIASDKEETNKLLGDLGLPVPRQDLVRTVRSAVRAAERMGYPVVVKPYNANHGRGVSLDLENRD